MSECKIHRNRNKTANFTIVSNEVFQRTDLSMKAKGLYAYLMTLPDDWKIYKQEIYKHFPEGRAAIDGAFKELEAAGYIEKQRTRGENSKFTGWDFTVYETVTEAPDCRKSDNREPAQSRNPQLLKTDSNKGLTTQKTRGGAPTAGAEAPPPTTGPKGKQKDEIAQMWEEAFTAIQPSSTWGDYGKERRQCRTLASRTRELLQQTPYDSPGELMQAVFQAYDSLKRKGRKAYWTGAPWIPSAMITRWPEIWDEIKQANEVEELHF